MALTLNQKQLTPFCQKAQNFKILASSANPIMLKFYQPVKQTLIEELQMTFQAPGVSICNGNMEYPFEASPFYTKF